MSVDVSSVVRKLRAAGAEALPTRERRTAIQMALMEVPAANPDDEKAIKEIDERLTRIISRFKDFTGLRDADVARIIRKSRPAVQAYVGGRIPEKLSRQAADEIERVLISRKEELDHLLADVRVAKRKASE